MRAIIALSLRFRYLVVAGAVALMFFGSQTLGHEKVDVFPEFAPVTVEIQTECLGLSPSEVEPLVTVPLENALQGVPRVTEVESESVPQLSAIFLYFKNGTGRAPGAPAGAGASQRRGAYVAFVGRATGDVSDRVRDQPRDAGRDLLEHRRSARPVEDRVLHDPRAAPPGAGCRQRRDVGRDQEGSTGRR